VQIKKNNRSIEAPRDTPRGIFDRKEFYLILIRSLTPQQAAGNALAIAVQVKASSKQKCPGRQHFLECSS
jgi:hypothetical protein